jgi:hypothetical protein
MNDHLPMDGEGGWMTARALGMIAMISDKDIF